MKKIIALLMAAALRLQLSVAVRLRLTAARQRQEERRQATEAALQLRRAAQKQVQAGIRCSKSEWTIRSRVRARHMACLRQTP